MKYLSKLLSFILSMGILCTCFTTFAATPNINFTGATALEKDTEYTFDAYNEESANGGYFVATFTPKDNGYYDYTIGGYKTTDTSYSAIVMGVNTNKDPVSIIQNAKNDDINKNFVAFDFIAYTNSPKSTSYVSSFTKLTAGKTYYLAVAASANNDLSRKFTYKITNHTNHVYEDAKVTPATTTANGEYTPRCSICNEFAKQPVTINKIASVKLNTTKYTYDGKAKKPSVTVKDSAGKVISSTYYTVSYSLGRKNVGSYTATVTFKGRYSGTVSRTYKIVPKGTSISKLSAIKKGFKATIKKQTTQTNGYQIQIATNSKFTKGVKKYTISNNTTLSKTVKKLKAKKKYYVRVRTYKTVNKSKYYSGWSKAKYVTTKK